ncbi:MAG TPA: hypothetical protein VFI25_04635 [Planctomycetota bacterium]|nr:hypothetical protein [Planctomycetota bacterium]
MITINLLPQDYRRRERTPWRLFAATMLGVLAASVSLAYAAYARFGLLARVRAERQAVEDQLEGLKPSVAYHDDLVAEKTEADKRLATIQEIRVARVQWTRKLDELAEIVNTASDADRYLVWFDELTADTGAEGKTGGKVNAKGLSGSDNFANVALFFEDLKGHVDFAKDFDGQSNPTGKRTEKDEELIPSQVWEFPLELILKKRELPKTGKAKGPKGGEAGKASGGGAGAAPAAPAGKPSGKEEGNGR